MGIKATVIYDINRHSTLVLRTLSVSISERYEVIDTIASFSSHCESLRGIAQSVTEVSAEWGGPPYVTYDVVYQRFRVIVIWDEGPAEFDISCDVDHCLSRLYVAVTAVQEALADGKSEALAKVYEEAGYALRGDVPIILPDPGQPTKKASSRPKLLPTKLSSAAKRSSNAEPKKGKSTGGSGGLLGKIGSRLKNVTSGGASSDQHGTITHSQRQLVPPQGSNSSLRPPSESAANSVAMYGSENGFDDELGELDLPEEMFAWADFGQQVSDGSKDLKWFEDLIHGELDSKKRPKRPTLRPGSIPSTPLTIQSSAPPLPQGTGSIAGSVPASGQQYGLPPNPRTKKSESASIGNSDSLNRNAAPSASLPASLTPVQDPVSIDPSISQNSDAAHARVLKSGQGAQNQSAGSSHLSSQRNQASAIVRPGYVSQSQEVGPISQLAAPQHPASESSSAAVLPGPAPSFTLPLATGALSPAPPSRAQTDISGASLLSAPPVPQTKTPPASLAIPPALASQLRDENDFDVSGLGNLKDDVAAAGQSHSASPSMGAGSAAGIGGPSNVGVDEALRSRMNEFAVTMQAGNFTLALQQVYATLKMLRQIQPRRERETVTCSNYVVAQKILIRNAILETELTRCSPGTPESVRRHIEMALLTMFLAELKHLLPRHRVAAMKVAIEKNIVVGNFGMCARWLRYLVERAPPAQKAEFSRRLEVCVRNGERNAQMPPTNRLCYITLQVLTSPYGHCSVCGAVYHPQMAGVVTGQICPTCFVGAVDVKV